MTAEGCQATRGAGRASLIRVGAARITYERCPRWPAPRRVRSRTSTWADTSASTRAAVVSWGRRPAADARPSQLAADMPGRGYCKRWLAAPTGRPRAPAAARPVWASSATCRRRPAAVVDDQHPLAEPLDVAHVVGGEQQRRAVLGPLGDRKCRSRSLLIMSSPMVGSSSTSSRGLWTSAAATSPRIRSPSDSWRTGVSSERVQPEPLDQLRRAAPAASAGIRWMAARIAERVAQREVPPQLAALPEHDADLAGQPPALRHRVEAAGAHLADGRHQDAGDHLDGGRLAGPVGADVAAPPRPRRSGQLMPSTACTIFLVRRTRPAFCRTTNERRRSANSMIGSVAPCRGSRS